MTLQPFYDPSKSYTENYEKGPFGLFSDGVVIQESTAPNYTFLGQPLFLPFGIPAGPLLNTKFTTAALDKGFDIVVYKTVREKEYPCHPWPNVIPVDVKNELTLAQAEQGIQTKATFHSPFGITNSFGVPSYPPEVWVPDATAAVEYARHGQVVIVSFQGTVQPNQTEAEYIESFVETAKQAAQTQAKILEVNLSCPNEASHRLLCFDTTKTKKILFAIREAIGDIPLIIKIAYFADQEELRHFVQEIGPLVDAISAINTIPAKVLNDQNEQALPGNGRLVSGICGRPIQWAGLEMIQRLHHLKEELGLTFQLVGVGGVISPGDYMKFRQVGADVVMSATGAMWNPLLAQEIRQFLRTHSVG